jgi:uncharacterized protein YjhX (UPF0386 family)
VAKSKKKEQNLSNKEVAALRLIRGGGKVITGQSINGYLFESKDGNATKYQQVAGPTITRLRYRGLIAQSNGRPMMFEITERGLEVVAEYDTENYKPKSK